MSSTADRDTIVFAHGLDVGPGGAMRIGGSAGGIDQDRMLVFGGGNWQIGNGNVQQNVLRFNGN